MIPAGAAKVRPAVLAALEDGDNELPMALRDTLQELLDAVVAANTAMAAIETRLQEFAERDVRSQRLQRAGGVGLLTATALSALGRRVRTDFPPAATSPVRSASRRANIPAVPGDGSAPSPSAATSTCARC